MDCTEIINHINSSTRRNNHSQNDSPNIPNIEILQIHTQNPNQKDKEEQVIVVLSTWTDHVCYVQAFLQQSQASESVSSNVQQGYNCIDKSSIELLWSMDTDKIYQDEVDEYITCLTLLQNFDTSKHLSFSCNQREKVAIVLGTNMGNASSFEIRIHITDESEIDIILAKKEDSDRASPIHPIPIDMLQEKDEEDEEECIVVHPRKGIKQFISYKVEGIYPVIWIVYGDGTCIRLGWNRFFRQEEKREDGILLEDTYHILPPLVTKWTKGGEEDVIMVPFLTCTPPLFRPPTNTNTSYHHITEGICSSPSLSTFEFVSSELIPDVESSTFSTTTHKNTSRPEEVYIEKITDTIVSGTKTMVKDMFGSVMGSFGWTSNMISDAVDIAYYRNTPDVNPNKHPAIKPSTDPFHFLRQEPDVLLADKTIKDVPRRILSISIHPLGGHAVTTDNLGRVLLFDLTSNMIIRIWKGVRDASCYWMTSSTGNSNNRKQVSFLLIQSFYRNSIEVYRLRHGPRVLLLQNVEEGCMALVQPCGPYGPGDEIMCFMVQKTNNVYTMKPLLLDSKATSSPSTNTTNESTIHTTTSDDPIQNKLNSNSPDLQLQLLQQVLSSDMIPFQRSQHFPTELIFDTLTQIKSLHDLVKGLDLILTTKIGKTGSKFYQKVVSFVQHKLKGVQSSTDELEGSSNTDKLLLIQTNLEFHQRVIVAYDILHGFEMGPKQSSILSQEHDDVMAAIPRSLWAIEAIGWVKTYHRFYDGVIPHHQELDDCTTTSFPTLHFSTFAQACSMTSTTAGKHKNNAFYLCDSTRDRRIVILRIFRPLLYDIFVYKVVNSILDTMNIRKNHGSSEVQVYFGEWFMMIPLHTLTKACFNGSWRPILRFLQEIIILSLDYDDHFDKYNQSNHILLEELYNNCKLSTDLVKAFVLASICQEAILIATNLKEAKSYGKISSRSAVKPWVDLLRKLRTCLVISLRVKDTLRTPTISVSNIEQYSKDEGAVINMYEILAYDEITTITQNNEDLKALEHMLRLNKVVVFSPSTILSDQPLRYKELMEACCVSMMDVDANTPFEGTSEFKGSGASSSIISDFNSAPGPLLKYFKNFNSSIRLASHRVLLLGELWTQKPESLDVLKNAVSTLKYLYTTTDSTKTTTAICIDFWQVRLRPIFICLFYGFDHDNVSRDFDEYTLNPLFLLASWREEVSRISMEVLSLLLHNTATNDANPNAATIISPLSPQRRVLFNTNEQDNQTWPIPPSEDAILSNIVTKTNVLQSICPKSLSIHKSILCSLQLTDDLPLLSNCFPTLPELFLVHSLFQDIHGSLIQDMTTPTTQVQKQFIHSFLHKKARRVTQPILHALEFHTICIIAQEFSLHQPYILSSFCLIMYDIGKDAFVDELITSNPNLFDMNLLIDGATQIVCERIHQTLSSMKKVRQFRGIIGMVDADLSQWIQDESDRANARFWKDPQQQNSVPNDTTTRTVPSLSDTHTLVHKLLWLANRNNGASYKNILLLSKFTGMLLKAVTVQSSNVRRSGIFSSLSP